MKYDIVALFAFLISTIVISIVAIIIKGIIDNNKRTDQAPQETQETPRKMLTEEEASEILADHQRLLNTQIILSKIKERFMRYLIKKNGSEALLCIDEAMGVTDPVKDAIERHFFLMDAIEMLYSLRDQDDGAYFACINVFQYDIDNIENLVSKMSRPFNMASATRICIIMERLGMFEEAIQICDICAGYNLFESGHKSFLIRKERLMKKMIRDGRG